MPAPARKVPSRGAYALPVAAVIAGAILSALLARTGKEDQLAAMQRFPVPGTHRLSLPAGQHLLYEDVLEDAPAGTIALRCELLSSTGNEVPLEPARRPERYLTGKRRGVAVFAFASFDRGPHQLTCRAEIASAEATDLQVAVGRGLGTALPLALIPAGVGLLVGLFAFLVIASKRRHIHAFPASPPKPGAGSGPSV